MSLSIHITLFQLIEKLTEKYYLINLYWNYKITFLLQKNVKITFIMKQKEYHFFGYKITNKFYSKNETNLLPRTASIYWHA